MRVVSRWQHALPSSAEGAAQIVPPIPAENEDSGEARPGDSATSEAEVNRLRGVKTAAMEEMNHYIKFLEIDKDGLADGPLIHGRVKPKLGNDSLLLARSRICLRKLRILSSMPPLDRGQNVAFMVDPGVMSEPSEAYTRAHNVYSRTPSIFTHVIIGSVKAAGMFASELPGAATYGCFDLGSFKANQSIRSQLGRAKLGRYQSWDLLPRQSDMEARLLFRHGTDEDQELPCCRCGVLV